MGAYKISSILKYIYKWENNSKTQKTPLKKINVYLASKLEQKPDEWIANDKDGLLYQQALLNIAVPKNKDGEQIEIIHRVLPKSRPKIGVYHTNFWQTQIGKNWLQQYNIKLKDKK